MEFAIIFPLVIALVFGIIEAGWALEQRHDVREDAQNLAREAAINFAEPRIDDLDSLLAVACTELDLDDDAVIEIDLPDGASVGDRINVTVTRDLEQVTGMFGTVLGGKEVSSTAWAQLEQEAVYSGVAPQTCDGTVVATPTPGPTPTPTTTPMPVPTSTPTPTPGVCTVPDFDGVARNSAASLWASASFTGSVTLQSGTGNYDIHYQSLTAGNSETCAAAITVGP